MKSLGITGQKWLKTFHLFAAILWIGCGIAMNLLRVAVTPTTPEGMSTLSLSLKWFADFRWSYWNIGYCYSVWHLDKMGILPTTMAECQMVIDNCHGTHRMDNNGSGCQRQCTVAWMVSLKHGYLRCQPCNKCGMGACSVAVADRGVDNLCIQALESKNKAPIS